MRNFSVVLLMSAFLLVCYQDARAALIFTFTNNGSGGVSVVGTGSGTATAFQDDQTFTLHDFTPDFLVDTVTSSLITADSTSGTLTNTTTIKSEDITAFRVDRDPGSNTDDIEFFVNVIGGIIFNAGDSYDFSLTSNFDSGTLAFSDLVVGSHVDPGGGTPDEIFGSTTINVVPEPSTALLLACGLAGLAAAGRRRSLH